MPEPSYSAWLQGKTDSGRTVHIDRDPYMDHTATILVDGTVALAVSVRRARDGGTTTIETALGLIHWPKAIGRENPPPSLNGEALHPV